MHKWIDVGNWKVKIEVAPTPERKWSWTYGAVDGPEGRSVIPAVSETAAYQQALSAAMEAVRTLDGPDSAHTDFNSV